MTPRFVSFFLSKQPKTGGENNNLVSTLPLTHCDPHYIKQTNKSGAKHFLTYPNSSVKGRKIE